MVDKGYRKLIAWQKSNLLAHLICDATIYFPKEELFGLTSQIKRAILSVCANIVEGYARSSKKDRSHFYQIALASLVELEFFIDFAYERKFITEDQYIKIVNLHNETAKILTGLLKSARL